MSTELAVCIVAEGVSLDSMTGRLSAFNMLESVYSASFPAVLPKLFVVTIYETEGEPERFYQRISLRDANGKILVSTDSEIAATEHPHRSISALWGTRFDGPGTYLVTVERAQKKGGPWNKIAKRTLAMLEKNHLLVPQIPQITEAEAKSHQPKTPASMIE